jgi:putative RecB family exonuclease
MGIVGGGGYPPAAARRVPGVTAVPYSAVMTALPIDEPADEAIAEPTRRPWALSPSRASDFMSCPLLYRFRVIDRLPEPPSAVASRGTLVHAVLERLFDAPAAERTIEHAAESLEPEWQRLLVERPELATLFSSGDDESFAQWLASARLLLETYFSLEDPRRIEPAQRELLVEAELDGGTEGNRLRGFVDRVDVAADGRVRIVDYKTGNAPSELFEEKALFQLKFYALVMWRLTGAIPSVLQLIYLGDGQVLRYQPDEADLRGAERKVRALWDAIERGLANQHFPARPSRLCEWCAHRAICPEFGGTPPPYPRPVGDAQVAPVDEPDSSDDVG